MIFLEETMSFWWKTGIYAGRVSTGKYYFLKDFGVSGFLRVLGVFSRLRGGLEWLERGLGWKNKKICNINPKTSHSFYSWLKPQSTLGITSVRWAYSLRWAYKRHGACSVFELRTWLICVNKRRKDDMADSGPCFWVRWAYIRTTLGVRLRLHLVFCAQNIKISYLLHISSVFDALYIHAYVRLYSITFI